MAKQKFSGNKKMINLQLAAAASMFKLKHPLTKFDTNAARRSIARRVAGRYGASAYRPHQGEQECARRVAKGQAPFEYDKGEELFMAEYNRKGSDMILAHGELGSIEGFEIHT